MATYSFNPFTKNLDIVGTGTNTATTANFKARQVLTPAPDGIRTVFTVPDVYVAGSITVYLNGLAESLITESASNQITFATAPWTGDDLRTSYAYGSVAVATSHYLLETASAWLMEDGTSFWVTEA